MGSNAGAICLIQAIQSTIAVNRNGAIPVLSIGAPGIARMSGFPDIQAIETIKIPVFSRITGYWLNIC
ncbi:MAG: hypothetical protein WCA63_12640 [Gallionella sp.]